MSQSERNGTLVEIRAGFFIVIAFMLLISDNITVLISLVSSLLHECGHIASMLLCGGKINRLVFSASGMRIDRDRTQPLGFSSEIIISFAGAAVNFCLALCSFCAFRLNGSHIWLDVLTVNVVIGLFNLLPAESLDGARGLEFILLRRIPEERVQRIIMVISVMTVFFLLSVFALTIIFRVFNPSFTVVIIYLLILLINRIFQLKKSVI